MKRVTMLIALVALVLAATLALAQTNVEQAPLTWQEVALGDGEALYGELCAVCHGLTGKGDGPAAPALAVELSDLTKLAAENDGKFPSDRIEKLITGGERVTAHGTVEMPVWGRAFEDLRLDYKPSRRWAFARARITNLTEYLKSIQAE